MSKRILDLNTISSASNDDYLVVDGSSGTRKITPENIVENSNAVHALEEHVDDVADDVDGLQINMGKAQGDIEELKNFVSVFVADVDESVQAWLDEHPEATTTVQDGAITEAKLASAVLKKLCSDTLYNVKAYGIEPDTGNDVYSAVFALMQTVNANGGGIVYFPKGRYIISDTIFIPPNTVVMGDGYGSELYYDATYTSLGAALTNGGDNVGITNIRINIPNVGGMASGANPGAIGFSTYDFSSLSTEHPSASSLTQRNTKNLFASKIYTDSSYILQTETGDTYTIENVIYEDIFAEKSCVSVMGTAEVKGVSINNVVCAVLRLGAITKSNVKVNANNIYTGRLISTGNNRITNMIIADEYFYDSLSFASACMHVVNTLILSNAYISTSQREYVVDRRLSKIVFSNVVVDAPDAVFMTYTQSENLYDIFYSNCIFNTQATLFFGYGSNVIANLTSKSDLRSESFRSMQIQQNADLNDYTREGIYQSPTSALTGTLTHCPFTGDSFDLQVMAKGNYVIQVIYRGSMIYTRTQTSNGFEGWYSYSGTAV